MPQAEDPRGIVLLNYVGFGHSIASVEDWRSGEPILRKIPREEYAIWEYERTRQALLEQPAPRRQITLPNVKFVVLAPFLGIYLVGVGLVGASLLWPFYALGDFAAWVWSWGWEDWKTFGRMVAIVGSVACLVYFYEWFNGGEPQARPVHNYHMPTVADFGDTSAYGDAELADRHTLQAAMMGHNVPHAPQFEE